MRDNDAPEAGEMREMGKSGVRLATRLPSAGPAAEGAVILCPWLDGPDPATLFWLGALSWHDANASLLAALDTATGAANVFAAMFCADPFRSPAALFERLRAAGVGGVVNLPSVTFLDGPLAGILSHFDLGPDRELRFLREARAAGFRVGGCVASRDMAQELAGLGAEFVIAHNGPPVRAADRGCDETPALLLRRFAGLDLTVLSVPALLRTLGEA